jgi:Flp pilus assembly protein TadD
LHARPEKALLVCFGAGNTASAIAYHDSIQQIDIVDLNDKVFETASEFSATNDNVYLDSRVRLIHDDGRNFLNLTDQTYDLITSEPPPPLAAGVYRLYSREYYMAALEHLTPDGLMTQWLPTYLMDPEAIELAITTFISVFPDALIFTGFSSDFILIGSKSRIDLSLVEKRFQMFPRVTEDLAGLRIEGPLELLARVVNSDGELRQRYSGKRIISDEHNDLERLFRDSNRPAIIWYEPKTVLNYLQEQLPGQRVELQELITHLGRLRYHVHAFPFESLYTVNFGDTDGIALGNIDWIQIAKLYDQIAIAMDMGQYQEVINIHEQLLVIAEEQPEVLISLANLRINKGRYKEALASLNLFQRLEPASPIGHRLYGSALMLDGKADEAIIYYESILDSNPVSYVALYQLAWIFATHPDRAQRRTDAAIRLAESAAELTDHQDSAVLNALAAAYASAGQFDRAVKAGLAAIDAHDTNAGVDFDRLNLHLSAYRNRQSLSDQSLSPSK